MANDWDVTQSGQWARITTALGDEEAFLEDFTVTETLSQPFRIVATVVCPKPFPFRDQLGSPVRIEVVDGGPLVKRDFHGLLAEAQLVETVDGGYRFRLTVRPWFWFLTLSKTSRIFQHQSAQDIVKAVFADAGVSTDSYDMSGVGERGAVVREYCVQYEESDFDFVSRLLEEEGVFYVFQHAQTQHVMKLCDSNGPHVACGIDYISVYHAEDGALSDPHLEGFGTRVRPARKAFALRDEHWRAFGQEMDAVAELTGGDPVASAAFEHPGGFAYLTDDGFASGLSGGAHKEIAKLRLDADVVDSFVYFGEGNTFAVPVGAVLDVQWDMATLKVLVVGAVHRLSGQHYYAADDMRPPVATVELEMVPAEVGATVWRPPRVTPRPFARGPQVATVVGKQGEEIDVDEFGRVRVQFPWDRSGRANENCSCWIRVSSSWAGGGMGEVFTPRVGQEVMISYLDGDMDRPVITGRLYNSKNTIPPTLPDSKTTSGWRTQTVYGKSTEDYDGAVNPPTSEPGASLLVFEDRSGSEKVYLHSQRDMSIQAYRDRATSIHRDDKAVIGRHLNTEVKTGNETRKVTQGSRTTTINQNETLTVEQGDMTTTVSTGNQSVEVSKGDQSTVVKMGNQSVEVSMGDQTTDVKLGNISIKADLGKIDIEAMQSITLKVGQSTVVVDQMGVTIKGMMIKTEAQIMHETKALMTQVSADAMLTLKGGITMIN